MITISDRDQPWFNEDLRLLRRQKQREYTKNGKSEKYLKLVDSFKEKASSAIKKYKEKLTLEVLEGERGSIYPALKRLGMRPGDDPHETFTLPDHVDAILLPEESVELVAQHFSSISQEYAPLDISTLPPNIQDYLKKVDQHSAAQLLSAAEVLARILKAKKPRGIVSGDLPRKLTQRVAHLLATPAAIIFNAISQSATYPQAWKMEHQIAIPKSKPPNNENDLRNIAKTPFLS